MGQERIIHAALLGAGTVGSGVYKLVKDHFQNGRALGGG